MVIFKGTPTLGEPFWPLDCPCRDFLGAAGRKPLTHHEGFECIGPPCKASTAGHLDPTGDVSPGECPAVEQVDHGGFRATT